MLDYYSNMHEGDKQIIEIDNEGIYYCIVQLIDSMIMNWWLGVRKGWAWKRIPGY